MIGFAIRRLQPGDSLEELTTLLRRAFASLGRLGLNCTCVDQTVDVTRRRVQLGDCLVAVADRQVVGTATLQGVDRTSPVNWYRHPEVASLHQFAVDPSHQGGGVGRALLRAAEEWARSRRYLQLALDTPEPAAHLRAFYGRRGFMHAETVRHSGKSYVSVVLSKAIDRPATQAASSAWPARHPAEMAALRRSATPSAPHSCRSASIGSICAARRAGK
jgi:GNAT superfamily N-acetyltransferase